MANSQRHCFVVIICFLFTFVASDTDLSNDEEFLSPNSSSNDGKLLLTPCCMQNHLYIEGLDMCLQPTTNISSSLFIPVYSNETNQQRIADEVFSFSEFRSIKCPEGFVSKSTKEFKLFNDGSLQIGDGRKLESSEFCINEVDSNIDASASGVFVARFCVPDPCVRGPCIRKCCPFGSGIYDRPEIGPLCLPHPTPFNVSQLPFQSPSELFKSTFTVHGGFGLKCYVEDGSNAPAPVESDTFSIMADGRMFNQDYELKDDQSTNEYCVDQMFNENETGILGYRCFPIQIPPDPSEVYVYSSAFIISSVFTAAAFIVHAILPELRNIHGVILMCYLASMSVMYFGFGVNQLYSHNNPTEACKVFSVFVQFACLATFSWLNVVCFDLWRTFGWGMKGAGQKLAHSQLLGRQFLIFSIYGWGVPLLIVLVGQFLQYAGNWSAYVITPDFGVSSCWFNRKYRSPMIAYLYGPMLAMIIVNVVMFFWSAVIFYRTSVKLSQITSIARSNQRLRVIVSLFLLMGVSWITEIISFWINGEFTHWVVTDILNILTGPFVFVIFVCKPKVWKLLKSKFRNLSCLERSAAAEPGTEDRTPVVYNRQLTDETNLTTMQSQSHDPLP